MADLFEKAWEREDGRMAGWAGTSARPLRNSKYAKPPDRPVLPIDVSLGEACRALLLSICHPLLCHGPLAASRRDEHGMMDGVWAKSVAWGLDQEMTCKMPASPSPSHPSSSSSPVGEEGGYWIGSAVDTTCKLERSL